MNQNTLLTSNLVKWLLIANALFILFVMMWGYITLSEIDSTNQQLYSKLVQQHDILIKRVDLSAHDLIALDDLTKEGVQITAVIADYMYYFKSYLSFLFGAVVVSVLGAWRVHKAGKA